MKYLLLLCFFLVSCASGPAITRRTTTKTPRDGSATQVTATTHVTTGYALAGKVEGVVVDIVTMEGDQIRGTIASIDGGTSWIGRLVEWWGLNKVTGTLMPATLKGTEDVTAVKLGQQNLEGQKAGFQHAEKMATISNEAAPVTTVPVP